jgi:Cu+-exporting ATPase
MAGVSGPPLGGVTTTSFLLSNLHCPSCISTIEDALLRLEPSPLSVSSSIVSSWTTILHGPEPSILTMKDTLEDVGFEIVSLRSIGTDGTCINSLADSTTTPTSQDLNTPEAIGFFSRHLSPDKSKTLEKTALDAIHIQSCEMCRKEAEAGLENDTLSEGSGESKGFQAVDEKPDVLEKASTTAEKLEPAITEKENPLVVIDGKSDTIWQATFLVGGMTCAVCVNSIERELREKSWIEKVAVNLLSNTATVWFADKSHVNEIIDAIEDIGFEAKLDIIIDPAAEPTIERIVEIKVLGMHCPECPGRVKKAIDTFGGQVQVDRSLSGSNSIMKIRYKPKPPQLTIRNILTAISDADDTLKPSVYHPPTLEERSAMLHAKERNRILRRVALSVVVAIPTFVIGVVYMSLVPGSNSARQSLEQMWVGVSRSQWALFILATPVYIYSTGIFHERAIKEVYNLWKPKSRTPILRRK